MKTVLLSPAGSPTALYAAINGGANAIYLGVDSFNARRNAENFTTENLSEYVSYAHLFGVKIYVTLNISVKEAELPQFFETAKKIYESGADAFILQDVRFGKIIKQYLPEIELHLSTQAGVNNVDGALVAKENGFCQVVLARETGLSEIEQISKTMRTEVFIQGALCSSFSGQCLFSSFVGGNSGNRGLCKQPCRQKYSLENREQNYAISLADLCVGEKINDLSKIGATCFKIEGRMRRPEYVYAATKYYRDLLDGKKADIKPLKRAYNRGDYTLGLAYGQTQAFISSVVQSHIGEKIGSVASVVKGKAELTTNENISVGSSVKILRNGKEIGNGNVTKTTKSSKGYACSLEYKGDVKQGDTVNITTDASVTLPAPKILPISVEIILKSGEQAYATAKCGNKTVELKGERVQPSQTTPLSPDRIASAFEKTDKYPFAPTINVTTENAFMPVSALNKMRRELYEMLYADLTESKPRAIGKLVLPPQKASRPYERKVAVIDKAFDFDLSKVDIAIFAPENYAEKAEYKAFFAKTESVKEKFLLLPPFMSASDKNIVEQNLDGFDGIYSDNISADDLSKQWNKKVFYGVGANIFNRIDKTNGYHCVSNELTRGEAKPLLCENTFTHAFGGICLMSFIYCPFGAKCEKCKAKEWSRLTDESGRVFPLQRYKLGKCRFRLFNMSPLVGEYDGNALVNALSLTSDQKNLIMQNLDDVKSLKSLIGGYTTGHSSKPVL